MAQLLASKVVVEEEAPRIRSIQALPTAVLAAVGITERGPVREQTTLTNFEEYVRIYGGFIADGDLTLAMQGFFQNQGTEAHISRTVHFTDITNPLTKTSAAATLTLNTAGGAPSAGVAQGTIAAPFALVDGDTLSIDIDAGGAALATFNGTAAARTAGNAETYALADGDVLNVSIDGGGAQAITFNTAEFADIANATALEVAAVINAEIVGASSDDNAGSVRITSDRKGSGSGVNVTGGTANAVGKLNFATGNVAGTGNVSNLAAVTAAEVKTVVEAAVAGVTVSDVVGLIVLTSNTTGAASSVLVEAASTADDEMGFDNATHSGDTGAPSPTLRVDGKTDGTYANTIKPIVDPPTSGDSTEFNLLVEDDGLIVETFPNVSMIDTAPNFVETIVNDVNNGSNLIVVTDLDSTAADPTPAEGTFGPMTGGNDGLAGLDDNDFIGSSAGGTGLNAFDQTQGIRVVIIPDRPTAAVANAMITYCDTFRDKECFAIIDPPAGFSTTQIITYVETTAAILNLSEFGAIYWPQIKILNPSKGVFGDVDNLTLPPSGHIAGVYARRDAQTPGGVFIAPANIENGVIRGMVGFENEEVLDEKKRDLLYPKRINPITAFPGSPRHIDGSRTLKGNGNFPSIPERRGVIFIEQSLKLGLLFLKHVPNTEDNRAVADRTVTLFLRQQLRNGAFASKDPATAFFVDVSEALNTPSVIKAGKMIIRIGLAMAKPAEFIIIRVTADTRALEEELASA